MAKPPRLSAAVRKLDKAIRKELLIEGRDTARDMANWLTVAVRDWTPPKPRFAPRVNIYRHSIEIFVDVAGSKKQIWVYVDQGTGLYGEKKQSYQIRPKTPGGKLKFQTGYSAKTAPVAKVNVGTGLSSGDWVTTDSVTHPGIKPRKFTEKVIEELSPDFETRIEDAIRRATR